MSELKAFLSENIKYNNFSEEVVILTETRAGQGLSLYQCKNKNGVTFQTVPGNVGLVDRGLMGYINGDRGRPVLLGPAAKVSEDITTVADFAGENANTEDDPKEVCWDIKLEIWAENGTCTEEDQEDCFVVVKIL